jgi:hypothetical protein
MKKLFILVLLGNFSSFAQQHYSGITTSSRTGILNGGINPAELVNISSRFSVNTLSMSTVASSNKVGLDDFLSGEDIGEALFEGGENTSFKINAELLGPGIAFKIHNFSCAVSTRAYARLDVLDLDTNIGDAIFNDNTLGILQSTLVNNGSNQRLVGTTWGEVALSAAKTLVDNEKHAFSAGITLKMLFPGSYANLGFSNFNGTINTLDDNAFVTDATASVNIAYSGNLGDDFTTSSDYFSSLYGNLNGVAADIGINYRLKEADGKDGYKLNAGLSVRNLGSMSFKSADNKSTNYELNIENLEALDLSDFENVTGLREIEQVFLDSGFLTRTNGLNNFKVVLPTLFVAYADVKLLPLFYITAFTQLKVNKDQKNDQIADENVFSVTPRFVYKSFEAYIPVAINEISGFNAGTGFRFGGFFMGSSSLLTAFSQNSKQVDFFLGYGFRI